MMYGIAFTENSNEYFLYSHEGQFYQLICFKNYHDAINFLSKNNSDELKYYAKKIDEAFVEKNKKMPLTKSDNKNGVLYGLAYMSGGVRGYSRMGYKNNVYVVEIYKRKSDVEKQAKKINKKNEKNNNNTRYFAQPLSKARYGRNIKFNLGQVAKPNECDFFIVEFQS